MDNMSQTVMSLDQNLLETLQNSTEMWYMWFMIKIDQSLLNGQYGSTRIVPD